MAILFAQNWDIIEGREDDYARFVSETYLPGTMSVGLISVGGYYVETGFGPRIVAVLSSETVRALADVVVQKKFKELTAGLKSFVCNYRGYVLEPTGRVKHEKYTIQKGVWKFNQYYDVRPGKKREYTDFVLKEHLPTMQGIDYVEVTGGWNVLFGGVSEIIAEFTFKDPEDIGKLLKNEAFRRITIRLKTDYATNYQSRILRCTERFDEVKWVKLSARATLTG